MKHILALVTLSILFIQCETSSVDSPPITDAEYEELTTNSFEDFSQDLTYSAARLFVELCQSDESDINQIISPLSIQTALAMLLNGAHQNTALEIKQYLGLENETIGGINKHFSDLSDKVTSANTMSSQLQISNASIWNNDLMTMNAQFLERMSRSYSADLISDDFTVEGINTWADVATDGLIKEVIQEIKSDEVLFLLNALLFRGDWLTGFDENGTQTVTTTLADGSETTYEMMTSDDNHFYFANSEVQAVNLKFANEQYELLAIQPTQMQLDDYIKDAEAQGLADILQTLNDEAFSYDRILLSFPKFEVKYKRNISESLKNLGLVDAFTSSEAKLDSLGTAPGVLYVTRVLHDTYFKLDERGVEGAAVTTVGVGVESVPPVIVFDKPFLICLRTSVDKVPVFIGKIGDPGSE